MSPQTALNNPRPWPVSLNPPPVNAVNGRYPATQAGRNDQKPAGK